VEEAENQNNKKKKKGPLLDIRRFRVSMTSIKHSFFLYLSPSFLHEMAPVALMVIIWLSF